LRSAAQDPLLRRLVTVHILATATSPDLYPSDSEAAPANRCARWLNIIKQANLGRIEDAEYLGWVAYNNGDYKGAAHWLELSQGDSGAALWLRAKLQRRDGKLAEAAKTMAQAVESLRSAPACNPTAGTDEKWTEYDYFPEGPDWGWGQSAHGDLGGLRLARGDFVQGFDTLLKDTFGTTLRLWPNAFSPRKN